MDLQKGCEALEQKMDIAYRTGELNTIKKSLIGRKSCDFAAAITFEKVSHQEGGGRQTATKPLSQLPTMESKTRTLTTTIRQTTVAKTGLMVHNNTSQRLGAKATSTPQTRDNSLRGKLLGDFRKKSTVGLMSTAQSAVGITTKQRISTK